MKRCTRLLVLPVSIGIVIGVSGFQQQPPKRVLASTESSSSLNTQKTATFGMGCFWAPSESMLKTDGVLDAVAGYTGGPDDVQSAPTYDNVCFGRRWVEAVRVTYDDDVISYRQLLDSFFENQVPKVGSRQYGSVIFTEDPSQEQIANAWIEDGTKAGRKREKDGLPVALTSIEPSSRFWMAEGYHQNYWPKWRVRYAVMIGLLAISTGALGPVLHPDPSMDQTIKTVANGAILLGSAGAFLERQLDAKVVEL